MNKSPKSAIFIFGYAVILGLWLLRYYTNGCLVLGGEGDFVLNWSAYLKSYGFSWHATTHGIGSPNFAPMGIALNVLVLWFIEKISGSTILANFILVYAIYFLPFLAIFLLSRELDASPDVSFFCSLFYVLNPFMAYYLSNLNQWNASSVTVMPLLSWIIVRYYRKPFLQFIIFGAVSGIFSFAYTNVPMFAVIHIALAVIMGFSVYLIEGKFRVVTFVKRYLAILISFVLFNFWWIPVFLLAIRSPGQIYTHEFANSWLTTTVKGAFPLLARVFPLTVLLPKDPSNDFYSFWYRLPFAYFITLIPLVIIVFFLWFVRGNRFQKCLEFGFMGCLLIVLFLVQGNSGILGPLYKFMYLHIPFFYIFKTPVEKFGLLYVFLFTVLILFVLKYAGYRPYSKLAKSLLAFYLLFCSVPMWVGQLIPDYKLPYGLVSRQYHDQAGYQDLRSFINKDARVYRLISFPGAGNYQVLIPNANGKYYTGMDPVIMNVDKPALNPYSGVILSNLMYDLVSNRNFYKLLGLFNVRGVILNEDLIPWFGSFGEIHDAPTLNKIFGKAMSVKRCGQVAYFENEEALPYVYASR